MSTITIEVPDIRLSELQVPAALLGVSPEDLARKTVEEFLARSDEDFEQIVNYLLDKNAELLRRLAK